ncbi:MAG: hypothetical protein KDE51_23140 [Anaerolineales bacterium]|nr:hypothetical protein [Anaerolineales bacterium]
MPDELAKRIEPLQNWLPTLIELSLMAFKTRAAAVAAELVRFLTTNPSPQAVIDYHVSDEHQQHLQRLLALNEVGMLSEMEQQELDELQQLEHIVVMLKAQLSIQ